MTATILSSDKLPIKIGSTVYDVRTLKPGTVASLREGRVWVVWDEIESLSLAFKVAKGSRKIRLGKELEGLVAKHPLINSPKDLKVNINSLNMYE